MKHSKTYDAPLTIGTRYPAISTLMPCFLAAATRNVNGKKPPKYMKKAEVVRYRNGISLNGVRNSISEKRRVGGGKRDLIRMLPRISMPSSRNAVLRMAQPKPMRGIKRSTIMGRITPPMDDPETTTPKARARWRENHVGITASAIVD
jgi:hypothetical protein